jgi:hypothetical protein
MGDPRLGSHVMLSLWRPLVGKFARVASGATVRFFNRGLGDAGNADQLVNKHLLSPAYRA